MSNKLYLLVGLRVPDVTALTAEETIRKRITGGERLDGLEHFDLWEFHSGAGGFRDELERMVRDSNLFVNPNKHVYRFTEDYLDGWTEERYILRVWGREDMDGVVARDTLIRRYGISNLSDVKRSDLWVMNLSGVSGGEGVALAESFGVTDGPRGGLLVNPHYQEYSVKITRTGGGERSV